MTRKERIIQQRILAIEGLSKLKAITELFGIENTQDLESAEDYAQWIRKVTELERWIFDESPIA